MNLESIGIRGKKVRKIIVACEILVFILLVAKVLVIGGIIRKADTHYSLFPLSQAEAEGHLAFPGGLPVRDVLDDGLASERKLLDHLQERQRLIESRENLLKSEEKKLETLKQEIVAKIETLKVLEEKLSVPLTAEDKKFKDLAKVYEAAPPAQVASILEKMDKKMAAAIISNMNNKKAGPVWGKMNPARAVEIAREAANFKQSE